MSIIRRIIQYRILINALGKELGRMKCDANQKDCIGHQPRSLPTRVCRVHQSQSYTYESKRPKAPPKVPVVDECCASGCVDCVWIIYCDKLLEFYLGQKENTEESLDKALKLIKQVPDDQLEPTVKAYLEFEIKIKIEAVKDGSYYV